MTDQGREEYLAALALGREGLTTKMHLESDPRLDDYRAVLGPELYRKAATVILAAACTPLDTFRRYPDRMGLMHSVEVRNGSLILYEDILNRALPELATLVGRVPLPPNYRISPVLWFAKSVMYGETFSPIGLSYFQSFDGYTVTPARFPRLVWDLLALPARKGAIVWPDGTRAAYDLDTDRYKIWIDDSVVQTQSVHDAAVLLVRQHDQVPIVEQRGG